MCNRIVRCSLVHKPSVQYTYIDLGLAEGLGTRLVLSLSSVCSSVPFWVILGNMSNIGCHCVNPTWSKMPRWFHISLLGVYYNHMCKQKDVLSVTLHVSNNIENMWLSCTTLVLNKWCYQNGNCIGQCQEMAICQSSTPSLKPLPPSPSTSPCLTITYHINKTGPNPPTSTNVHLNKTHPPQQMSTLTKPTLLNKCPP